MFLSLLQDTEKEDFLNLIINVAEVDGKFTDAEKNQINAYALEMGLHIQDKTAYNKSTDDLLENFTKSSIEVKKAVFVEIIALMLVDGMQDEESEMLKNMQAKFGFDTTYTNDVIAWYKQMLPLYRKGFELVGIGGTK